MHIVIKQPLRYGKIIIIIGENKLLHRILSSRINEMASLVAIELIQLL